MEANLDIVMDRMRQDATEQALKQSLTRALDMLEKIKERYNAKPYTSFYIVLCFEAKYWYTIAIITSTL
jgi:hypothetical protein